MVYHASGIKKSKRKNGVERQDEPGLFVGGRVLGDGGVDVLRDNLLVDGRVAAGDHAGVGLEGLVGLVCGLC